MGIINQLITGGAPPCTCFFCHMFHCVLYFLVVQMRETEQILVYCCGSLEACSIRTVPKWSLSARGYQHVSTHKGHPKLLNRVCIVESFPSRTSLIEHLGAWQQVDCLGMGETKKNSASCSLGAFGLKVVMSCHVYVMSLYNSFHFFGY